jgi:Tol biopolymer transport system component
MNKFTCVLLLLSFFASAQNDKKGNVLTNTGDAAKMGIAKQKLYSGNLVGALNAFREIEKNNSKDAPVLYYIGYCYFNMKDYNKAKDFLLRAEALKVDVKPETFLYLGKIFQLEENYDKAMEEITLLRNTKGAPLEALEDGELIMAQCQVAKNLIARPLNIQISNLGPNINSKYDDKNPCVSADARSLVFTTRRPETTDAPVDAEGDGKYFENIYLSSYDSVSKGFVKAEAVNGAVNTKAHDACTSISPDGKQIFIYKNDLNDKNSRGGDVFVSKISQGKWKKPEPLGKPVASSYWEGGACLSPDGKTYFFTSEREGGFGKSDIWMVEKLNKKDWGKPINLGANINTKFDEGGMFLAPDGKTLFFCSNGPQSMGGYDIFKSVLEDGKWSAPQNVGFPINSSAKEGQLTLSADTRYAYFSSERKGGLGESDIYKVDLQDYAILEKDGKKKAANALGILKGTIREGFEGYGIPEVLIEVTGETSGVKQNTSTNEVGEYFLTLRPGKYLLSVTKAGYQEIKETIEIAQSDKEAIVLEKGYLLKK